MDALEWLKVNYISENVYLAPPVASFRQTGNETERGVPPSKHTRMAARPDPPGYERQMTEEIADLPLKIPVGTWVVAARLNRILFYSFS